MSMTARLNPVERRKRIGGAVWLLCLLVGHVPGAWDWSVGIFVACGVTDEELAARLGVQPRTIAAWCRKLRAVGVLRWMVEPGVSGRYLILQHMELLGPYLGAVRQGTLPSAERPQDGEPNVARVWLQ